VDTPEEGSRLLPILAACIVGFLAVVLAFSFRPYESVHDPKLSISTAQVRVEPADLGTAFIPTHPKGTALVLYPEARVPSSAYSYLGRALADAGYAVFLADMPFHLANLDRNRARRVRSTHPEILRWVIGGHGLGGRVAASYAATEDVSGLVLLASAPGPGTNLANIDVLSIAGSRDGIATPTDLAATRALLPAGSRFIEIEGGNHVQFGQYRYQEGDGIAEIGGEAQREIVIDELVAFLGDVDS
jgi:dienelactone hydrolase